MPELSQKQLEEMVEGKPQTPRAVFYDKARMHVEKSKAAGRRIYVTVTYIKETQAGVTDWVAVKARDTHFKQYPEEYQHYLNNRQGIRSPSIDIIPNINPSEIQELIDYGLSTIRVLAEAKQVPPHLTHIHRNAQVLQSIFEEQSHASDQTEQENRIEEDTEESPARLLSEANRQVNTPDVRQPVIPEGSANRGRETPERIREGRRDQRSKSLNGDWSMNGFTQ